MHPSRAASARTRPLWPAPLAGLVALALYARTLAPGLTWAHYAADGGDLLAAALTAGVPHPSGYPTYQMLLRAAIFIFPGEPARAGNWLSALCAAAAVALFADLAGRMLTHLMFDVGQVGNLSYKLFPRTAAPDWLGLVALAAALTWAASPIFWGQAVVTEVYTFNALIVVALLWLLWRWREAIDADMGSDKGWPWLASAGLLLGLGLGNHLTLLLMLPSAAIWLWAGRRAAGRPLASELVAALAAVMVGLTVYAYLPLAAAANPPVNWLDPRRPAQLWALISGQMYRGLVFDLPLAYLPARLVAWNGEALRQFGGIWGAVLAVIGLSRLDRHLHAWWQATLLIAVTYSVYAIGYNTPDSFVYLIPASCVAALWLAAGLAWLVEKITMAIRKYDTNTQMARRPIREFMVKCVDGRVSVFSALLAVLLLTVPVISATRFWRENDLSHDREAQVFMSNALADAAPDALILSSGDEATFALWYALYGLGQRPDVAPVNVNLVSFDWYRRALAGRHPDLGAALSDFDPAEPMAWLGVVASERPLYRVKMLGVPLPGYAEQPEGSLVRLIRDPNE